MQSCQPANMQYVLEIENILLFGFYGSYIDISIPRLKSIKILLVPSFLYPYNIQNPLEVEIGRKKNEYFIGEISAVVCFIISSMDSSGHPFRSCYLLVIILFLIDFHFTFLLLNRSSFDIVFKKEKSNQKLFYLHNNEQF